MGKKVAIITHYWKSDNFGGNLQAYALPTFLNKNGFEAKQICYDVNFNMPNLSVRKKIRKTLKKGLFKFFMTCLCVVKVKFQDLFHKQDLINMEKISHLKHEGCKNFQENIIPHTNKEYNDDNIKELNYEIDFFITGSDQVFNYSYFKEGYWLGFAAKPKISYAASMALDKIPNNMINFTKNALSSFKAIGVREEKTVELYSCLLKKQVVLNVDPTLLLSSDDWDKVSSQRIIDENYVFCYFLGNNPIERALAKEFAQKNNLKLVCIPFYKSRYKLYDMEFGDINFPYASIENFISLIKYASYIFTDSFHAAVFSMIYHKQYVVFNRDKKGSMNSRIISLTKLFRVENRFLDKKDRCNIYEVEKMLGDDTSYNSEEFYKLKELSVKFLLDSLK